MRAADEKRFELRHEELDLLAWNIANELINGFKVADFEGRVGTSLEEFGSLAVRLRSISSTDTPALNVSEVRAFYHALALTLRELGEDEFETRTGHSFENGNVLLGRLALFLKWEQEASVQ